MKKRRRHKRRLKANIRRFWRKFWIIFVTISVTLGISGYIALLLLLKGPSPTFSNLVVTTMMETRRGDKIAHFFFSNAEIEKILNQNGVQSSNSVTTDNNYDFNIPENEKSNLQIIDVNGATFKGKLMIVRDPSRIDLGVNILMDGYKNEGFLVEQYVSSIGAIAGINGGGFDDPNGRGDGSIPQGVVIKDGKIVAGKVTDWGTVIGFNQTHHLIVGKMTGQQALDWGLTDAVTFGPTLIVDGKAEAITGTGGGLNPRTVIGQSYDGSVLLLVIDGRHANSLGASYEDCIKIMLEYGAVNAANLDGGSSSVMVHNGQIINSIVSIRGDRSVPTAWLVK